MGSSNGIEIIPDGVPAHHAQMAFDLTNGQTLRLVQTMQAVDLFSRKAGVTSHLSPRQAAQVIRMYAEKLGCGAVIASGTLERPGDGLPLRFVNRAL